MNITGALLILVIVCILATILATRQTGGALPQVSINNRYEDPYYAQQYKELDSVDNFLNRPLHPRDAITEALVPVEEGRVTSSPTLIGRPARKYLDFKDIITEPTSEKVKTYVSDRQPYFFDDPVVVDYYGKKFYWDWRYPRHPISTEFATDPEKFCREHPKEYPSYVIAKEMVDWAGIEGANGSK